MHSKNKFSPIFKRVWIGLVFFVFLLTIFIYSGQSQKQAVAQTSSAKKKCTKKNECFRLDFNKANMEEFLKMMSDILRKNILIDGKVPGNVTIVSPEQIPIDQAFLVLKSVLAQYGFMPIEENNIIRIVQIAEAIKMDTELRITSDLKKFDAEQFDKSIKNVTHLVILHSALSSEVRNVLQNLATKDTKLVDYTKANAIVLVGNSKEILQLIALAKELDQRTMLSQDAEMRRNIHIYHLENANAEKLAPVLARLRFQAPKSDEQKTPVPQQKAKTPNKDEVKVDIIANKETNSLIITAPPETYREVKRIIQELDSVRSQVLVEVLILEITGDDSWGAGIEWRHGSQIQADNALGVEKLAGSSALLGSGTNLASDYAASAGMLPGLSLGLLKGAIKDSNGNIMVPDIYAFLNYYVRNQQVNILSTPQILVTANQDAEINVGQQIPVISNMRITDQNNTIRSYDLKPVGIKLKITPSINQNGYIALDLYQEIKSLLGDTSQLVDVPPIISSRDIKTRITVPNRKTVVIGGLISTEQTDIERKTPILGDIPILGWLFKRRTKSSRKTNLLVFITPYLINTPEDMDTITNRQRIEIEKLRMLYKWDNK